jgi:hypothetical protein
MFHSQLEQTAKEVCAGAAMVAVAAAGVALVSGLVASHQASLSYSVCNNNNNAGNSNDSDSDSDSDDDDTPAFSPADFVGKSLKQMQDAAFASNLRVRIARVNEFGRVIDAACMPAKRVTCNVTIRAQPLVAWTSSTAWAFAEANPANCLVTSVSAC